jgi:Xaa-Pro aminopeptidase
MRTDSIKALLTNEGLCPFLTTNLVSIRYITGFDGSYAQLLFIDGEFHLITDGRYAEYAHEILGDSCRIHIQNGDGALIIRGILSEKKEPRLFVEQNSIVVSAFRHLEETLSGVTLLDAGDCIDRARMIKDESEISILREAAAIADSCVGHLTQFIRHGMTEWDISVEIEHFYRTHACRKTSFDTIVASGEGSSMPHYIPSMKKKIEPDAPLMIDMGCLYNDYNSDLTRTFFVDSVPDDFEKIYDTVLDAQTAAVAAVAPGKTCGELDAVARDIIAAAGFGENFNHSLGHGVGLQVHELPALRKGSDLVLTPGCIVTVEPGIYIPRRGGVRIEDMVLVTETGFEVLTHFSKDPMVL